MSRASASTALVLLLAGTACAPLKPRVEYQGSSLPNVTPVTEIAFFRDSQPPSPFEDLGTVRVSCPTEDQVVFGRGRQSIGGCSLEGAVEMAGERAAEAGAHGLHSVETSTASNGKIVSLTATAFRFTAGRRPKASAPAPTAMPSIEERLKRLHKLREDGLITPEDFESRKAEILKDI